MSSYRDYPCWNCRNYENCGKEHTRLSYKFERTGECNAYNPSSSADEIVVEKRQNDFRKHIEYLIDNRIPRKLW